MDSQSAHKYWWLNRTWNITCSICISQNDTTLYIWPLNLEVTPTRKNIKRIRPGPHNDTMQGRHPPSFLPTYNYIHFILCEKRNLQCANGTSCNTIIWSAFPSTTDRGLRTFLWTVTFYSCVILGFFKLLASFIKSTRILFSVHVHTLEVPCFCWKKKIN